MATYEIVSKAVPSQQRTLLITSVAAGDQIDLEEILGRPARGVKFATGDSTDVIEFRLNSLLRLRQPNPNGMDSTVKVWSAGPEHSVFSATGATEHDTKEGLRVSSVEIVSLTLASGTTIELVII